MSFHDELRNRLRLIPLGQPPAPWRPMVSQAVGMGMTAAEVEEAVSRKLEEMGLVDGRRKP